MPLFSFGSNGSGQLGIGHTEDVSSPTRCLFSTGSDSIEHIDNDNDNNNDDDEDDDEPVRIVAGGNHTLALFRSGTVYAAGSNKNGQCAHDPEKFTELLKFSRVVIDVHDVDNNNNNNNNNSSHDDDDDDDDVKGEGSNMRRQKLRKKTIDRFKFVSATWEASLLVDAYTGRLYVCGAGDKGELGLGEGCTQAKRPSQIPKFPPSHSEIVSLSSSIGHTVLILSNGDIYGWGGARKGQLGNLGIQKKILWSPQKIEEEDKITFHARQIACGREFTAIAGDAQSTGEFVILGSDKWGVLTSALLGVQGYHSLAASWYGVYVHVRDGTIRAWGRNDRGQIPPQPTPRLGKIAVGSEHVVAVTETGRVAAMGWGEHGNCGPRTNSQGNVVGAWSEIPFTQEAGHSTVVGIGAGCATSWIITR